MTLAADLRAALDAKAKPLGSLGRLEDLAVQIGVIQGTRHPAVTAPVVLVFAGDHRTPGISAYPSAVTAAMVGVYLSGRAAINVFARQAGARLLVIDTGVDADLAPHPGLTDEKLGRGAADWTQAPALGPAAVDQALSRAAALVDSLADAGTSVIALGEMGIGNTASAALLAHKIAGLPLLVGRGAGLDDTGLQRKQAIVARGSARTAERLGAHAALCEYGGFEIAMLTGVILQAARRHIPVVVDGVIVTAAALAAQAIEPACIASCIFAHRSAEPGHDAMLAALGATPLLDLGLRLGEGTGAALAIPLLRAACAILSDLADLSDVV